MDLSHLECCTGLDGMRSTLRLVEVVRMATGVGEVVRCSTREGNCTSPVRSRYSIGVENLDAGSEAQYQKALGAGLDVVAGPAVRGGDDAARSRIVSNEIRPVDFKTKKDEVVKGALRHSKQCHVSKK
jgi:hypothetical protein